MEKKGNYVQDEETTVLKESKTMDAASGNADGKTAQALTDETADEEKKSPTKWKQVSFGAVSGIVIGAAGVLFSSSILPDDESDVDQNETGHHSGSAGSVEHEDYQLDSVNDEMTFSDAFAAARAELGPGGVFEWHGNLYTTDTVEEWNAAHPQTVVAEDADIEAEVEVPDDSDDSEIEVAVADDDSDDVEVLGVLDPADVDDAEVHAEVLNLDGDQVLVVDVDNDGVYDAMVSDISDMHLTDEDLSYMTEDNNSDADVVADDGGADLI